MSVLSYSAADVVRLPRFIDEMKRLSQESFEMFTGVNQVNLLICHILNSRKQPYHNEALDVLIDRGELRRVWNSTTEYYLHPSAAPVSAKIAITSTGVLAICLKRKLVCLAS